jgi:hypothetical protein
MLSGSLIASTSALSQQLFVRPAQRRGHRLFAHLPAVVAHDLNQQGEHRSALLQILGLLGQPLNVGKASLFFPVAEDGL